MNCRAFMKEQGYDIDNAAGRGDLKGSEALRSAPSHRPDAIPVPAAPDDGFSSLRERQTGAEEGTTFPCPGAADDDFRGFMERTLETTVNESR